MPNLEVPDASPIGMLRQYLYWLPIEYFRHAQLCESKVETVARGVQKILVEIKRVDTFSIKGIHFGPIGGGQMSLPSCRRNISSLEQSTKERTILVNLAANDVRLVPRHICRNEL